MSIIKNPSILFQREGMTFSVLFSGREKSNRLRLLVYTYFSPQKTNGIQVEPYLRKRQNKAHIEYNHQNKVKKGY